MTRRRRFRIHPGIYLAFLGVVCGVLVFDRLVMPRFVRSGEDTEVPDLRGRSAERAEAVLAERGLRVGQIVRHHDEEIEPGAVARQSPAAGMRVKRGRAVDLAVSMGAETRRVPDLEGQGLTHARFLLQRERLAVGRVRAVPCADVADEQVMATSPPAETGLGGRGSVDLLVSRGAPPRRYIMPDLRGAAAEAAEAMLRRVGFAVTRTGAGRGSGPAGSVQGQRPAPGQPVSPGEEIELAVAR
ncbi:MAG: PASTA domain-containing protein [Candidatus Eisenbacteria bacterium]|uniref:PASTA domain-containing protein n=1 Tax=Eiseniibacteriota bacterium TaxID=2212470 RepID=A0A937X6X8_UNCEI|nr:PASTA domain-containing protein [Candidatus Eisenbacteria bacterium]